MYAKIKTCSSVKEMLLYQENKMILGQAACIYANRMAKDADRLSVDNMRFHFKRMNDLNDRIEKKMLGITLTFHLGDKMSDDRMVLIARDYMEQMGLGKQTYLVFRHNDTQHPHMHIVGTRIMPNGQAVRLLIRDYLHSAKLTKEMERKYGLTQTGDQQKEAARLRERPVQKLEYGKMPLVDGIRRVIKRVIGQYRYKSVQELNVVLSAYNIEVLEGREQSFLRRHGGLYYRLTDQAKPHLPLYIKASQLPGKPTLKNLEKEFEQNKALSEREEYKLRVKLAVDKTLFRRELDISSLQQELVKERISLVRMQDETFYIDHLNKTVFDGRSLGAGYDRPGLQNRCRQTIPVAENTQQQRLRQTIRSGLV